MKTKEEALSTARQDGEFSQRLTSSADLKAIIDWCVDMGVTETISTEPVSKMGQSFQNLKSVSSSVAQEREKMMTDSSSKNFTPKDYRLQSPSFTEKTPSVTVPTLSLQGMRDLVAQASTLEELRTLVTQFEGCALKKMATHTVFGDGNPKAPVMLVGEAPGADEDRQGLPFVGRSGKLLDLMFASIGFSREKNLYISNIIPWRPPGNRQPTSAETAICLPFIQRHIELVHPQYLVFVGGVAAQALMGATEGIMRLRGKWCQYTSPGLKTPIKAMPIYHPAYLLRSPGQKRKAWQDLLTLKLDMAEKGLCFS